MYNRQIYQVCLYSVYIQHMETGMQQRLIKYPTAELRREIHMQYQIRILVVFLEALLMSAYHLDHFDNK